ncbi:unnamed protein product [Clonostachys byssicola]|uniref:Uncharacterized protein n=1 Tax=Clonostachys byssicola TaxID=160290 RepID=A0A9N9XVV3_9HYPO|nr:unnamed protein product [Clonostachys byssicola]
MENVAGGRTRHPTVHVPIICELWNGEQVVRCRGPSLVTEFIILNPDKKLESPPEVVVQDRDDGLDGLEKHLEDTGPTHKTFVIRSTPEYVPSISLNSDKGSGKWELWVFAATGCILQLGVVTFGGFPTY